MKGGPCKAHRESADEEMARKKAAFLELFADGEKTLNQAGRLLRIGKTTLWRWRRQDPEFDRAVTALVPQVEDYQVAQVEETLFERCRGDKASPAERIFYLVNKGKGRWRSVQHVRVAGEDGGALRTENVDVDPADLTDEELQRVAAGESVLKVLTETRSARRAAPAEPTAA